MHIFRWLMTHPIVTAWILAALAILLNLNMGTKSDHDNSGHDQQITHEGTEPVKTSNKYESGTDVKSAIQETEGQADIAQKDTDNSVSLESGQEVDVEKSIVSSSVDASESTSGAAVSIGGSHDMAATSQAAAIATPIVASVAKTSATPDVSANEEIMPATSADEQTAGNPVNTEGLESMKSEDLIQLAREAFWQNNKEKSVAIYQALILREPNSLAHKGELANVYWHQNKQKESASLYAEIAVPMVEAGKSKEVSNMLGFIGVFFPKKAAELQHLISE